MNDKPAMTFTTPLWPHGESALMHLIRRASQRTTACWATEVNSGLSAVQYAILVVLAECGQCDQQTLGARAGFDKATGTYLIDRMVKSGLIVAAVDEQNRRRKRVAMTAEGQAMMERMISEAKAAEALCSKNLSAAEVETLKVLLTKLAEPDEEGA